MEARERVVVVGASGFGRECLDVLEAMIAAGSAIDIVGVVDDAPSNVNRQRLMARGVKYVGTITEWLAIRGNERYVLGIGSPAVRRTIVATLDAAGIQAIRAIHPNATIGAGTVLGEGVVVCAGSTISTNVSLAKHVHVNPNATIGHDADLRDFVSINPAAVISGEVLVESDTLVGAAATVLQNLTVGQRTIVGAGSVVTKDVPAGAVVKGVPGVFT